MAPSKKQQPPAADLTQGAREGRSQACLLSKFFSQFVDIGKARHGAVACRDGKERLFRASHVTRAKGNVTTVLLTLANLPVLILKIS